MRDGGRITRRRFMAAALAAGPAALATACLPPGRRDEPALTNARRGFFLAYINSFNEWHERTAFEPAANLADLTPAERAIGYHNPDEGRWRLDLLQDLLHQLTTP
jgi:hypothetical protein